MSINRDIEMRREFEQCREAVEERLSGFFSDACNHRFATLLESMRYSLLAGGKRIRAVICIKFCEAVGGRLEYALDAACAIEMLHTYTLIHDDLPCMDDDGMRRGKPSNHVKYGESAATLAGDALQAAAFETLLDSGLCSEDAAGAALILAQAAGPYGICGGQYLDLLDEKKPLSIEEIMETHSMKTSALISASARIGVIAGKGSPEQMDAADRFAKAVGLAFQIRDDLLDFMATEDELGKPIGSDKRNDKETFATIMSIGDCEALIRSETEKAVKSLSGAFQNAGFLVWLANSLAERKS